MKRDMDLCRKILLSVEAREGTVDPVDVELEGYTDSQIGYHAKLLAAQGLLEGEGFTGHGDSTHCYKPRCLTYKGHDFLEAARDDTRWRKAKAEIAEEGLPVTWRPPAPNRPPGSVLIHHPRARPSFMAVLTRS